MMIKALTKREGFQTVDKVRGDAADFSCVKVSQIQCLSGIEALFSVIIEVSKLGGGQPL